MSKTVVPALDRRDTPLWRNAGFQLMWVSIAATGFGERIIELAALPMLGVIDPQAQVGSKAAAVYFWYFVPWIFVTVIGGWLADTFPRKWLMLTCDEGRAAVMLWAALLIPAGVAATQATAHLLHVPHWQVYLIIAAVGAMASIFSPARIAILPQLVGVSQLNSANAILVGIGVVATLMGYLTTYIMEHYSVRAAIWLALLCFAVSGLFFIFIKPRPHVRLRASEGLSEWVRLGRAVGYIRTHRPVLDLILLNTLLWSMAMVVAPAIVALCVQNYGVPRDSLLWQFSKLNMCLGIGMMAGAGVIAWMNIRREAPPVLMISLLAASLCLTALALSRSHLVGMAICFLIGVFGGIALILVSTITQAVTPNFILGRVTGAREVLCNVICVGINLTIWQFLPDADRRLVGSLYVLAALLAIVAVLGLMRHMVRGPCPQRLQNILWHLLRLYTLTWHRVKWIGKHRVPRDGPVILAPNHTAGLDPFVIQGGVQRVATWVMLKSYQYRILWWLWDACRPIGLANDAGDIAKIRAVVDRLKAGEMVGLFPEGGIEPLTREMLPFQPGIGMIAVRGEATIVPVWIDGTPRRKNILWQFAFPSRSTVVFGEPYKPDPKRSYPEIARELRERMIETARSAGFEPKESSTEPARAAVPSS